MEPYTRIQLPISGMTCINCQNKIETELNRTSGVISAHVSYDRGTAHIVYDPNQIPLSKIIAVIEKLGYEASLKNEGPKTDIARTIAILAVILALYTRLQSSGILNRLAPGQLADTKMGYGMLFVIGLITSIHCIAMCGGISLSQCIPRSGQDNNRAEGRLTTFYPALAYNLGRVLSYTAAGFLFGLLGLLMGGGAKVGISPLLQGVLKIIAGALMVIMGINMLGLFPQLRRFTVRVPGFLARRIGSQRAKSRRPFIVGILNGFMPCGPLQSMWLVALASANPFTGALSMLLFSLGTVPLMLGLGSIVSVIGKRYTDQVMTVGAVLVVVLGLAMLSQGGSLSGWLPPDLLLLLVTALFIAGVLVNIPVKKPVWRQVLRAAAVLILISFCALWHFQGTWALADPDAGVTGQVVDGVQVVNSTLSPGRYPSITVQAGVPVKWVIDAPTGSINGCNYKIMIRDYGIEHVFRTGENIIEFTPEKTGTIRYSCWMGMIHGNIFVTDETTSAASADSAGGQVLLPTPAGYSIPTDAMALASLTSDKNGNSYQEVTIQLTDKGFSPAILVVQRGLPTIWNMDCDGKDGENGRELLVPYYSTRLNLRNGANQLSLYPTDSFEASTGDNRFYCYVKVVDDLNAVDEDEIRREVAAFQPLIYPEAIFEQPGMSCCGT